MSNEGLGGVFLVKPEVDLFEKGVDGVFGGDGSDFLALAVDDGFVFSAAEGDVGVLSFAGSVDDASHDSDGDGCLDGSECNSGFLDEVEEVDFGAAAGGAGDEFGSVGPA